MDASQYRRKTHLLPRLVITKMLLFLIIPLAASISFNYQQFSSNDYENLRFDGDVYQEKGVLQLTRYVKDSAGRVTYYKQLQLWDMNTGKLADFATRFSFIINAPNKTHHGDGITFYLAHPNFSLPVPPDGSGIGLVGRKQMEDTNYPKEHPFVAVEFDTFPNDDDPPYDHVGIDIRQMWTPYTTEWYSIKDGRMYDAEINYNSSSHKLNVFFTGYKGNITVQQSYSHEIDLREVLPDQVQFGFSSATGLLLEIHTLCSWSFDSSLEVGRKKGESRTTLIVGLSIGLGVVIGGLCLALLLIWNCRANKESFDPSLDNDFERSTALNKYSYSEISLPIAKQVYK